MTLLAVAAVQTDPRFGAVAENVASALELLPAHCDLAVLPELFASGYQFRDRAEALSLAEEFPDGPVCQRLRETAAERRMHLVAGLAERDGQRLYNSAILWRPDGTWERYRKVHLFWDEKKLFDPGNLGFPVFGACGTTIGLMICFDWIFPEATRTLALAGARVICHPSNLVLPHCPHSMVVRCLENRIFAITANRVGEENRTYQALRFIGKSQVIDPDGERLAACDEQNAGVALARVDLARTDKRVTPCNDLWEDRRPQMYRL